MEITYLNLEKYFTAPKIASPFYKNDVKIPRKLKKKVKKFCGTSWEGNTNCERLWYYMEKSNPDYKRFLIKEVIRKDNEKKPGQ